MKIILDLGDPSLFHKKGFRLITQVLFCGIIRDDNEFKGEIREGSSGDSHNTDYDEIINESPLLPTPYTLKKRVIPNESTLYTFSKPGI